MATRRGFEHTARVTVLEGGPPATTLVGGEAIGPSAVLLSVRHVSFDLVTNSDVTADASIVGPGQLQLGVTDTTLEFVVVTWVTG